MALSFKHIAPFLSANSNKLQRWFSYIGLGTGVLLLLCSIQMYVNINHLLKDRNPKKDGHDYISVTKTITNENMGGNHSFSHQEIEEIKSQPFIEDATPLIANNFLVKATGGSAIPFTADLFLESIDNSFIDTIPPTFNWGEGQQVIPVIISSDYLELYNTVFAPSKELPQFSAQSISAVMLQLECYAANGVPYVFKAHVVALSDRINSVLVPQNFLSWANGKLGSGTIQPSRIFIKTKDANSAGLLNFLQEKQYNINKDKVKFGRIKQVLQTIVGGISVFGILVIILALMLFSFYLQLVIARSKANLQLLLTLGYSPSRLSKTVAKRWAPVYIAIIIAALASTLLFQYGFHHFAMNSRADISPTIHWSVGMVAIMLSLLSVFINYRQVSRLLHKL